MFAIGVETGHARAAAIGQRYHTLVATLHQHRRIHHAFSDIHRVGTQHCIDVVRNDAAALLEPELLVGRLILHIVHHALLHEPECHKRFLAIRRIGRQLSPPHSQPVHRLGFDTTLLQVGHDRRGV